MGGFLVRVMRTLDACRYENLGVQALEAEGQEGSV